MKPNTILFVAGTAAARVVDEHGENVIGFMRVGDGGQVFWEEGSPYDTGPLAELTNPPTTEAQA